MPDIGVPFPYEWLFVTAVHWRVTLALVAVLAFVGSIANGWPVRVACFVAALLLGGSSLMMFLMPER